MNLRLSPILLLVCWKDEGAAETTDSAKNRVAMMEITKEEMDKVINQMEHASSIEAAISPWFRKN